MYKLPYFQETDEAIVIDFMRKNPFAFLNGCNSELMPVSTQVPVFCDERDGRLFLSGHIMRNTDHHKAFMNNKEVLVVFNGAHCYVSATWYSDPHQASTWNYMSVHARGKISFGDEDQLVQVLRKTTLHFEGMNPNSSTTFDKLDKSYVARLLPAIAAFEIEVESIENIFKLSQNRDHESFLNIIHHLEQGGENEKEIAAEMSKRIHALFPDSDK